MPALNINLLLLVARSSFQVNTGWREWRWYYLSLQHVLPKQKGYAISSCLIIRVKPVKNFGKSIQRLQRNCFFPGGHRTMSRTIWDVECVFVKKHTCKYSSIQKLEAETFYILDCALRTKNFTHFYYCPQFSKTS